jgi:hypothetical protein
VTARTAQAALDALARFYAAKDPSVGRARLFGFDCLRANGAVFVKVHGAELVMKLGAKKMAALVEAGRARPYRRSAGRPLRDWAVVVAASERELLELAGEARRFAAPG